MLSSAAMAPKGATKPRAAGASKRELNVKNKLFLQAI